MHVDAVNCKVYIRAIFLWGIKLSTLALVDRKMCSTLGAASCITGTITRTIRCTQWRQIYTRQKYHYSDLFRKFYLRVHCKNSTPSARLHFAENCPTFVLSAKFIKDRVSVCLRKHLTKIVTTCKLSFVKKYTKTWSVY